MAELGEMRQGVGCQGLKSSLFSNLGTSEGSIHSPHGCYVSLAFWPRRGPWGAQGLVQGGFITEFSLYRALKQSRFKLHV
jgi:hypothetical protein